MACLSWNNDPDRYLIDLSFDSVGNFIKVELKRFTLQDIKPEESDQIYQLGKEVAERRMFQYHQTHKGKIGRNQLCPCGSGKSIKNVADDKLNRETKISLLLCCILIFDLFS